MHVPGEICRLGGGLVQGLKYSAEMRDFIHIILLFYCVYVFSIFQVFHMAFIGLFNINKRMYFGVGLWLILGLSFL